jgi:hypothetical protein
MNLTDIQNACQGERAHDWRHEQDEPEGGFLHRAIYLPDERLLLDWGMTSEEAWDAPEPDWASPDWGNVIRQSARALYAGEVVWRLEYAYINRGAGMDGYMPWLNEDRDAIPGDPSKSRRIGWSTTRWELSFAALLNALQGNAWDFDVDFERRGRGILVREGTPFDP